MIYYHTHCLIIPDVVLQFMILAAVRLISPFLKYRRESLRLKLQMATHTLEERTLTTHSWNSSLQSSRKRLVQILCNFISFSIKYMAKLSPFSLLHLLFWFLLSQTWFKWSPKVSFFDSLSGFKPKPKRKYSNYQSQ